MKRKNENDDGEKIIKKRKTNITQDKWQRVNSYINENTVIDGEHLLWKSEETKRLRIEKREHLVSVWYYLQNHRDYVLQKGTRMFKSCNEEKCISHYLPSRVNITSVNDMTPEEYFLASFHLDNTSVISDIDPGNKNLTTKCRISTRSCIWFDMVYWTENECSQGSPSH